jgi:serine/threonine protein kinase
MLGRKSYSYQNDVWQLGVTMYYFASLRLPFEGDNVIQIKLNQKLNPPKPLPSVYSHHLKNVIEMMLEHNPRKRLLPRQLLDLLPTKRWIKNMFLQESKYFGQKQVLVDPSYASDYAHDLPSDILLEDIQITLDDHDLRESFFPG